MTEGTTIQHEGKSYKVSADEPQNGDLVLTNNYGVWKFRNDAPHSVRNRVCYAPLPYWANKNTCKKLIPHGSTI